MTDVLSRNPNSFDPSDVFLLLGASAGIGLAVAEELARSGASLILCAREPERLSAAVSVCHAAARTPSQNFQGHCLDLVDPGSPVQLARMLAGETLSRSEEGPDEVNRWRASSSKPRGGPERTENEEGPTDVYARKVHEEGPDEVNRFHSGPPRLGRVRLRGVLLNGGGPHGGSVADLDPSALEEAHALLFKGPVLHLQAALPHIEQGGSVVAITSTTVKEPHPALTLSGCYRTALTSYLKSLSLALGPAQIRVNALAPGFVGTEQLGELLHYEAHRLNLSEAQVRSHWEEKAALGRIACPSEIAKIARFLFSSESSFVTGQTLVADGGQVRAAW